MSIPPIEIRWGGGKWPNGRKRAVRPTIQAGLEIVGCAISEMGVTYEEPKTATVWCTGMTWQEEGGAELGDSTNFEIYLPHRDVKRRKVGRWLPGIVASSVHELLHLVREETGHDTGTLIGRIADEGLANYGEFTAVLDLLTPDELALFYQRMTPTIEAQPVHPDVLNGLVQDNATLNSLIGTASFNSADMRFERAWLEPMNIGALSAGERLGVSAVARHVNEGIPFCDVMQMPAEQILGIE